DRGVAYCAVWMDLRNGIPLFLAAVAGAADVDHPVRRLDRAESVGRGVGGGVRRRGWRLRDAGDWRSGRRLDVVGGLDGLRLAVADSEAGIRLSARRATLNAFRSLEF